MLIILFLKDLFINVERLAENSLRVKWHQIGNFTNYQVSRYILQTSVNEEPFIQTYHTQFMNKSRSNFKFFS